MEPFLWSTLTCKAANPDESSFQGWNNGEHGKNTSCKIWLYATVVQLLRLVRGDSASQIIELSTYNKEKLTIL